MLSALLLLTILGTHGLIAVRAAKWSKVYRGNQYLVGDYVKDADTSDEYMWKDAKEQCHKHMAHLAIIPDEETLRWLEANVLPKYTGDCTGKHHMFWAGLHKHHSRPCPTCKPTTGWHWLDGTPLAYGEWYRSEPDKGENYGWLFGCTSDGLYRWSGGQEKPLYSLRYICSKTAWTIPFNDHEYLLSDYNMKEDNVYSWREAKDKCEAAGGALASISDHSTMMWLTDKLLPHYYGTLCKGSTYSIWVGLGKVEGEPCQGCRSGWKWQDSTDASDEHWHTTEPSTGDTCGWINGCSAQGRYSLWGGADESEVRYRFLCSRKYVASKVDFAVLACRARMDDDSTSITWVNHLGQTVIGGFKEGPEIFGASDKYNMTSDFSLVVKNLQEVDAGDYTCVVRKAEQIVDEAQSTLTV